MNLGPPPAADESAQSNFPPGRLPGASGLQFVKAWIWLAALASLAGWSLSALGQLNRTGYVCFFAVAAGTWLACRRRRRDVGWPDWRKSLRRMRRFRRPLPAAFAVLTVLVLVGSVIHPPSNYTGLNYHLARVLQWLASGRWHWVHTLVVRMNFSGCAFEWLTTPVVLFTRSDRALFLVNFIPFLLLPGLIFSLFTRLGVRRRVAWHWMWLLPTSYNLLLQAGSIGNDAFAAPFALAAIDFAFRAWESRRISDLWHSVLAAALLTGTKAISLPLLLPWAILVFPLLPWFRRHWLPTLPVLALAALASFIPLALLNQYYAHDWLGRSVELAQTQIQQPAIGLLGNFLQVLLNNFVPPVFPPAGWWNTHAMSLLPHTLAAAFNANFEPGFLFVGEVPTEDFSGLGFGISGLLVVSVLGAFCCRGPGQPARVAGRIPGWLCRCVLVAAWLSLLAYCMKSGLNTAARLLTPYYLLLVPLLLTGSGQSQIIRRIWWRVLAAVVLVLALIVLVISPDRPLWPAQTILSKVLAAHPGQAAAARALEVYTVYSQRNDALAGVRALLPPDLKTVGFIGDGDDCDISLWRPFGSRRVEHFLLTDPPEMIRSNVNYVVVGGWVLDVNNLSLDDWLRRNDAQLVATTNAEVKIAEGRQSWHVTRFQP